MSDFAVDHKKKTKEQENCSGENRPQVHYDVWPQKEHLDGLVLTAEENRGHGLGRRETSEWRRERETSAGFQRDPRSESRVWLCRAAD